MTHSADRTKDLMSKAFLTVAKHYADKLRARGEEPTEAEVIAAVQANWSQVSGEISRLYALAAAA